MIYEIALAGQTYRIEIERACASETTPSADAQRPEWKIRLNGRDIPVDAVRLPDSLSLIVGGKSFDIRFEQNGDTTKVLVGCRTYDCTIRDPRSLRSRKRTGQEEGGEQKITASMPGKVVRVLARVGEPIAAGQGILVIEAMKMQNEVRSPRAGVLKSINVKEGANVNAGAALAIIE